MNDKSAIVSISVLMAIGCQGRLDLGSGDETDARLTADVYTWECTSDDVDWMGVYGFSISLVYTPDNLASRELPAVNTCERGVSMFALDTLEGGTDVPDVDVPRWQTNSDSGRLERQADGLYHDDVFKNVFSCDPVNSIVSGGIELVDAGRLSGVQSPKAGQMVSVQSSVDATGGLPFGEEVELSWDAQNWSDSFVQIRRARSGVLVETLTCNTTGAESLVVDDAIWSQLNGDLAADTNYLYVGFRNSDNVESEEGQRVDVETRALHVVGLTDL